MRRHDPQQEPATGAAAVGVDEVLDRLRVAVDDLVDLDPSSLGPVELTRVARGVTTTLGRLESTRARCVKAAETSGAAAASGARDGATWLADATGGTLAGAKRAEKLGRAMDELPELAAAVSEGRVGGDQATSLAAAVDRGVLPPDRIGTLVREAERSPAGMFAKNLKAEESRTDQAQRRRDERLARQRRRAGARKLPDGSVDGDFLLDPVTGETFLSAWDALSAPDPADVPDELRRTAAQRRADGLALMAELALSAAGMPQVAAVRPHITVAVPVSMFTPADADELDDEQPEEPDGAAEVAGAVGTLPDGTVVSAAATRRLLCDATVRRLVLDPQGQPLDVGRATRTWSGAQRAAIHAMDGGCRGPACDRPAAWTQIHHVRWWRRGGDTSTDNGVLLCDLCHDLVHHGRWRMRLEPTTREVTWTSPDGRTIVTRPRGPAAVRGGGRP